MKIFFLFLAIIILQRFAELIIAKQNEKWMLKQGGIVFGEKHYKMIVGLHIFFFIFFLWEVFHFGKTLSSLWPVLLIIFILTQAVRVWALSSLGKYWNTKIIVLPDADVVMKGPYKYMKHPNYVIVTLEFIIIPLIFQAYLTAIIFSVLNMWMLSIRIPEEEKALSKYTSYHESLGQTRRFLPKI